MNCIRSSGRNPHLTLIAILFSTFANAFNVNNEVLEYWEPSSCKYDEYFDTVSLSCSRCNASKNLAPAANRKFIKIFSRDYYVYLLFYLFPRARFSPLGLRCVCDRFSRTIGFENGNPLCTTCDLNTTVTADGRDCILRANATCKCSTNQIKCNFNNFFYHKLRST